MNAASILRFFARGMNCKRAQEKSRENSGRHSLPARRSRLLSTSKRWFTLLDKGLGRILVVLGLTTVHMVGGF